MKKLSKTCAIALTFVLAFSVFALFPDRSQAAAAQPVKLHPIVVEDQWGYINDSGVVVIKPQFDYANNFSDGLALVKVDELYGYINEKGTYVFKPQFDKAINFDNGTAYAYKYVQTNSYLNEWKSLCGYINNQGKVVINYKYSHCAPMSEGVAWLMKGAAFAFFDLIDSNGKYLLQTTADVKQDNKGKQNLVLNSTAGIEDTDRFSQGLAAIKYKGKWGFIDKKGKFIVPAKYEDAFSFSEGLAPVKLNGKWGYIDLKGKMVIPSKFEFAGDFTEQLAVVISGGKVGYINSKGTFVIKPQFEEGEPFSDGMAVVKLKGKNHYINKTGKIVIDGNKWSGYAFYDFNYGIAALTRTVKSSDGLNSGISISYINKAGGLIYAGSTTVTSSADDLKSGIDLLSAGKAADALAKFKMAIKKDPKTVEGYYYKARALGMLGKYTEAYDEFEYAEGKSREESLSHQIKYYWALTLYAQGEYEAAYYKMGRYDGADPEFYYAFAYICAASDNVRDAIDSLHMAAKLDKSLRDRAKSDPKFNSIKDNTDFINVLNGTYEPTINEFDRRGA